jgi:hypothetical protein
MCIQAQWHLQQMSRWCRKSGRNIYGVSNSVSESRQVDNQFHSLNLIGTYQDRMKFGFQGLSTNDSDNSWLEYLNRGVGPASFPCGWKYNVLSEDLILSAQQIYWYCNFIFFNCSVGPGTKCLSTTSAMVTSDGGLSIDNSIGIIYNFLSLIFHYSQYGPLTELSIPLLCEITPLNILGKQNV